MIVRRICGPVGVGCVVAGVDSTCVQITENLSERLIEILRAGDNLSRTHMRKIALERFYKGTKSKRIFTR